MPALLHVADLAPAKSLPNCLAPARLLRPRVYTIQADVDRHIEVGIFTSLNHSCAPNVLIDTANMRVIAAQDIPAGAELTYFYPSSEWEMANPFVCHCGNPACIQVVAGAKHLSVAVLGRYFVNRHIQTLIDDLLTKTSSGTYIKLEQG